MRPSARQIAAIALAVAACGSDKGPQGLAEATARHYDYTIDLESRAAQVAITLEVTTAGNCFDIPIRATDLTDVTLDGDGASGTLAGGVLEACGNGWEVGETVELAASAVVPDETWGESQVGFSVTPDAEGNPFTYLVSWVGGCDQFAPCDNRPDTMARYTFRVSHPADHTVLCPGAITRESDTQTVCDFADTEAPTYSTFGVMASPSWVEVDLGSWNGVAVTLYDLPSIDMAALIDVDQHAAFLAWMSDRFGPYPYGDELRLAVAPTYWNGFEHPGNIALSESLPTQGLPGMPSAYADPLAHTINHELAHMWAGDRTTLASVTDFVWKEAMAEYLTYAFTDEQVSAADAQTTNAAWKLFSRTSEFHPVPTEAPPLLDFYGDVYGPGPMVLFRQLEVLFSREQMLDAIAEVLAEPILSVDRLKTALETATGAELTAYFDRWVIGEGQPIYPQYTIATIDNGDGTFDVTAALSNSELGLAGGAFNVRLTGDNGETEDVRFDLGIDGAATTTITAPVAFEVTGFQFDPLSETLALGRAATAAPVAHDGPRINPWVVPAELRRR